MRRRTRELRFHCCLLVDVMEIPFSIIPHSFAFAAARCRSIYSTLLYSTRAVCYVLRTTTKDHREPQPECFLARNKTKQNNNETKRQNKKKKHRRHFFSFFISFYESPVARPIGLALKKKLDCTTYRARPTAGWMDKKKKKKKKKRSYSIRRFQSDER